jgi:signal transduction histidine kinase
VNQQLLLTARQAGMAEVASSVLHNVGNVLNSVSVSSAIVAEKIDGSKLSELKNLSDLIRENKGNFSHFVKNDPRGIHIPDFIEFLSAYWQSEQSLLENEIKMIIKNVDHIKNIIASQQDFSRLAGFVQAISIQNTLEEAILISGIDNEKYFIHVKKDYALLKPVLLDKVKLLQILVNLIQNAKESLLDSNSINKEISFKIFIHNNYVHIEIADTGIGIPKENLIKIFTYGFTTKKEGHGFGIHMCAVSAKEMGGELKVESEGVEKGAKFIVILPYRQI